MTNVLVKGNFHVQVGSIVKVYTSSLFDFEVFKTKERFIYGAVSNLDDEFSESGLRLCDINQAINYIDILRRNDQSYMAPVYEHTIEVVKYSSAEDVDDGEYEMIDLLQNNRELWIIKVY